MQKIREKQEAILIYQSKFNFVVDSIRTCWQSFGRGDSNEDCTGELDKKLVDRIGNKYKHTSTLVHSTFTFTFTSKFDPDFIIELLSNKYIVYTASCNTWTMNLRTLKEFNLFEQGTPQKIFCDLLKVKLNLDYQDFLKQGEINARRD